MRISTGWAYALACLLVLVSAFIGMCAGALLGNAIVPARLDWSGQSGPGLLLVGALLGAVGGVVFGIWSAARIVRAAKVRSVDLPPQDPAVRRRRAIAVTGCSALLIIGFVVFLAWPRPICDETKRGALLDVHPFGGVRVPARDFPVEGASEPGGCEIVYTAEAPADEIASYYVEELHDLGWSDPLADMGLQDEIGMISRRPYTLWIHMNDQGRVDPAWRDMHYYVTIKDLGGSRVLVVASVVPIGHPYG